MRHEERRHLRLFGFLVCALAVAACGTRAPAVGGDAAGTTEFATQDELGTGSGDSGAGSTVPGAQVGATPGGQATTPSAGGGPQGSTPGTPERAADSSSVKIGFVVSEGDAGARLGVGGFNMPGTADAVRALVADLNERGGLGGHPVDPFIQVIDQSDQDVSTQQRLENEACIALTEDEKVLMVVSGSDFPEYSAACYARHRTPFLAMQYRTSKAELASFQPYALPPLGLTADRMAIVLPSSFKEANFLTKKMAIIGVDRPAFKDVAEQVLIPELERLGGDVIDSVYMPVSFSSAAPLQGALLRFAQRDVDRVVLWFPGGGIFLLATRIADGQGYHPRWGISSYDFPAAVQSNIPESQLEGSLGTGVHPMYDLSGPRQIPVSPAEQQCYDRVNSRTGQNRGRANGIYVRRICETLGALEVAFQAIDGHAVTAQDVPGLVRGIGDRYRPIEFASLHFTENGPDAFSSYSPLRYSMDCHCFEYGGSARPLP